MQFVEIPHVNQVQVCSFLTERELALFAVVSKLCKCSEEPSLWKSICGRLLCEDTEPEDVKEDRVNGMRMGGDNRSGSASVDLFRSLHETRTAGGKRGSKDRSDTSLLKPSSWATEQQLWREVMAGLLHNRPVPTASDDPTGVLSWKALATARIRHLLQHPGFFGSLLPPCKRVEDPQRRKLVLQAEARMGIGLPDTVRSFYSSMEIETCVCHAVATNNDLEHPNHFKLLKLNNGCHVLRILNENQGCCTWFILMRGSSFVEDPPVFCIDGCEETTDPQHYKLQSKHFSDFWHQYAEDGAVWYKMHPQYLPTYPSCMRLEPDNNNYNNSKNNKALLKKRKTK